MHLKTMFYFCMSASYMHFYKADSVVDILNISNLLFSLVYLVFINIQQQ